MLSFRLLRVILLFVFLSVFAHTIIAGKHPTVIIVGAGISVYLEGISAGKTLSEGGIKDILILEATDRIGGRIKKINFAGINVEEGANWVEGVNGPQKNPIWDMVNNLNLRNFFSDFSNVSSNTYQRNQSDDNFVLKDSQQTFDETEMVAVAAENYSRSLPPSGYKDISILTYQRFARKVPSSPVEMVVDYYNYDYEFAEPPRLTSLQGTQPLPTLEDFGEDLYFVADKRGYEFIVYDLAKHYLTWDKRSNKITDQRMQLNKVVNEIIHTSKGVTVKTKDGSVYTAEYVILSPSIGVLQSGFIKFTPELPDWKRMAISQFDMSVYTKIFLKLPYSFWPTENGTNFFLYADDTRGYYPIWQHFTQEYPDANVLMVTVTDMEARRIEQQPDQETKEEAMAVLRSMFGEGIPNATDIHVPKWWSDPYYKGGYSNWPIGVNKHEYDQLRCPVGRVHFTGEHTSERYNGYVHGGYLAGNDSATSLIGCIKNKRCDFHIRPKE